VKLVLTHDDSSVFPVDDEDYDVFFDDLEIEQAPSLSHLAFGLTDGVHFKRTTYQAYGATESDYRPDRWKGFREDYRFTGKEEDIEVGLTYFGKRFLRIPLHLSAESGGT
jgi:hypothetical protein